MSIVAHESLYKFSTHYLMPLFSIISLVQYFIFSHLFDHPGGKKEEETFAAAISLNLKYQFHQFCLYMHCFYVCVCNHWLNRIFVGRGVTRIFLVEVHWGPCCFVYIGGTRKWICFSFHLFHIKHDIFMGAYGDEGTGNSWRGGGGVPQAPVATPLVCGNWLVG